MQIKEERLNQWSTVCANRHKPFGITTFEQNAQIMIRHVRTGKMGECSKERKGK